MDRKANTPNQLKQSMMRLAGIGTAVAMLMLGATAVQAAEGDNRVSNRATAQASVTILRPAIVRTALFEENNGWANDVDGTDVRPIGESRRDCASPGSEGRCNLVVYDMP